MEIDADKKPNIKIKYGHKIRFDTQLTSISLYIRN